jgi:hypothetical protein
MILSDQGQAGGGTQVHGLVVMGTNNDESDPLVGNDKLIRDALLDTPWGGEADLLRKDRQSKHANPFWVALCAVALDWARQGDLRPIREA